MAKNQNYTSQLRILACIERLEDVANYTQFGQHLIPFALRSAECGDSTPGTDSPGLLLILGVASTTVTSECRADQNRETSTSAKVQEAHHTGVDATLAILNRTKMHARSFFGRTSHGTWWEAPLEGGQAVNGHVGGIQLGHVSHSEPRVVGTDLALDVCDH